MANSPNMCNLNLPAGGTSSPLWLAYALDVPPTSAGSSSTKPTFTADGHGLALKFFAARPGYSYVVQTSGDGTSWEDGGAGLSEIDADGFRTASFPRDSSRLFVRVVVTRPAD